MTSNSGEQVFGIWNGKIDEVVKRPKDKRAKREFNHILINEKLHLFESAQ